MRSDLKAAGVTKIETDLDELTCRFEVDASLDVSKFLNGLAESNSKMAEWTFFQE